MNKYYPESMVSAMQAMSEVESIGNTARRISEEYQSQISRALRPVMNQAAFMQIDIKPMSFDLSAIKMQTELNLSITEQMRELSMVMQHPALEAFKELSVTNDFLTQMNMRGILYKVSTMEIDEDMSPNDVQAVSEYNKSVLKSSSIAAHEVATISVWTYTAYQIMKDPNLLDLFMIVLDYIVSNGVLLMYKKDED